MVPLGQRGVSKVTGDLAAVWIHLTTDVSRRCRVLAGVAASALALQLGVFAIGWYGASHRPHATDRGEVLRDVQRRVLWERACYITWTRVDVSWQVFDNQPAGRLPTFGQLLPVCIEDEEWINASARSIPNWLLSEINRSIERAGKEDAYALFARVESIGWPFEFVSRTVVIVDTIDERLILGSDGYHDVLDEDDIACVAPTKVRWLIATLSWGAWAVGLLLAWRSALTARTHYRSWLGKCGRCGYDRRGLRSGHPCPECGHTLSWSLYLRAQTALGCTSKSGG